MLSGSTFVAAASRRTTYRFEPRQRSGRPERGRAATGSGRFPWIAKYCDRHETAL